MDTICSKDNVALMRATILERDRSRQSIHCYDFARGSEDGRAGAVRTYCLFFEVVVQIDTMSKKPRLICQHLHGLVGQKTSHVAIAHLLRRGLSTCAAHQQSRIRSSTESVINPPGQSPLFHCTHSFHSICAKCFSENSQTPQYAIGIRSKMHCSTSLASEC